MKTTTILGAIGSLVLVAAAIAAIAFFATRPTPQNDVWENQEPAQMAMTASETPQQAAPVETAPATDTPEARETPEQSPYVDDRWYILGMKLHDCFPVEVVFGVQTPYEVKAKYEETGKLETITKDDGHTFMMRDANNSLDPGVAFLKGKEKCLYALKFLEAQSDSETSSN